MGEGVEEGRSREMLRERGEKGLVGGRGSRRGKRKKASALIMHMYQTFSRRAF